MPEIARVRSTTVGRQAEIDALHDVLARAAAGRPQVVEIYGEVGIGKTRLLDELAALARDRAMELAPGRAVEQHHRGMPFGVVAEALSRLDLSDDARAVLDAITPDRVRTQPLDGAACYRLYQSVRALLAGHARPPGLVVFIDDLHWADEASQELLEQLLLDMPRAPLLLALAYRAQHVPPGLPSALARTRAELTRLALGPLAEADIATLLPDQPPARRRLLAEVSGGNPLYLAALDRVDEHTLTALADPDRADPVEMPRPVQALLMTELRSLDPGHRLVAQAVAVAGDPAELELVIGVADRPEHEVCDAMDALVALGVVHTVGARFRFRHPLVRVAAYQSAGPAWRIGAHRRAERHLRGHGGSLPLRAHHVSRAARPADTEAADTLAQAAAAVLGTEPASAAEWARAAFRLLPEGDARRVELLVLLAKALGLSNRLAESREILHEVLQLAGPARLEAVRYCAIVDRLLGRLDESRALLEAELAGADSGRGALLVELAATDMLLGSTARCASSARNAVNAGKASGDRGQVAAGTTLLGLTALREGDVGAAGERLAAAVRLVDGLSDVELRDHLHVLPPLAWLELHLERYADGDRHVARGIEIARASGTPVLPYLLIVAGAIAERTGRLAVAGALVDEAGAAAARMGSTETVAMTGAVGVWVTLWRQGPGPAIELAGRHGHPRSRWWAEEVDAALVTALLVGDRPAVAMPRIAAHLGEDLKAANGFTAAHWCSSLALASLARGECDEALDLAEHAVQLADRLELPYQQGIARLAEARVLAGCGRLPQSVDEFAVAADCFTRAGAPLYLAMAHDFAAASLAAAGDLQRARVELGKAKAGYASCEAGWLAAMLRNSESRLGARTPRPRRPSAIGTVDALSTREREIARLVADGLTNREIATALFLSAKTVEGHLARVFTKLGVRSRVGVAQRLAAGQPG